VFLSHAKERSTQCAMLAGSNIVSVTKSKRNVNEKKDEKRALKGSKNLWLSENTTSP
jgi:hypothetical protein